MGSPHSGGVENGGSQGKANFWAKGMGVGRGGSWRLEMKGLDDPPKNLSRISSMESALMDLPERR